MGENTHNFFVERLIKFPQVDILSKSSNGKQKNIWLNQRTSFSPTLDADGGSEEVGDDGAATLSSDSVGDELSIDALISSALAGTVSGCSGSATCGRPGSSRR